MFYGTIEYEGRRGQVSGQWVVRCEPYVRTRMKRVFPKVKQWAGATVEISDTPENSRELAWFILRYPMGMTDAFAERLHGRAEQHLQQEQRVAALLEGRVDIPPVALAEPAREYQLFAAAMLETRRSLLLADQVGGGKTTSAICSLVNPENLPALVVCPTNMPSHWVGFIRRFAPDLKVHSVKKGRPYPFVTGHSLFPEAEPDVIICNYFKLRGWADSLAGRVKMVVFDEGQQLRRPDSEIYRACAHVAEGARTKLCLSATPIYNYGGEFWNVLNVIEPGALGTWEEFSREWCDGYDNKGKARLADPEAFGAYLRREGMMLRRSRKDMGRELPPLQTIPHYIDCDTEALEKVSGNAMALARIILAQNEAYRGEKMNSAGKLDALIRQATGVAKAPYVAEFVRLLLESGEKVLLLGWHREFYSIVIEKLKEFNPRLYTGSETPYQKDAAKKAFIDGETDLLIMSLRAAAGTDGLQHVCSTVVVGELDWSPGVHEQGVGRVFRDGQENPVTAYFLLAEDGCDPVMAEVLGIKRDQIEGAIDPGAANIVHLEQTGDHIREVAKRLLARSGKSMAELEMSA